MISYSAVSDWWPMLPLAVASSHPPRVVIMVILFFVSLAAVAFPEISRRSKYIKVPRILFFIGRHFGTGVILSTAFSHLLQEAFESLQKPIVRERYNNIGQWTGLIMLSSLLLIFLIEYISSTYVERLYSEPPTATSPKLNGSPKVLPSRLPPLSGATSSQHIPNESTPLIQAKCPVSRKRSHAHISRIIPEAFRNILPVNHPRITPNRADAEELPEHNEFFGLDRGCVFVASGGQICDSCSLRGPGTPLLPCEGIGPQPDEESPSHLHSEREIQPHIGRQRQIVGLMVLQLGIMIHSLAIGLTLAVISGSDFASLTTAIVFHQIFEGLSLGIRISSIPPPPGRPQGATSWLTIILPLLFGITTPLGMGIGLLAFGPRSCANPARMELTQGLLSAVSASMLIYAATVEMLAGDFIFGSLQGPHDHSHNHHHSHSHAEMDSNDKDEVGPAKQVTAIVSLLLGVIGMQLVGLGE